LFPGAVRPYKNIDGLLRAMAMPECHGTVLVVAGRESGYDGWPPGGLSRTREMAQRSGVADRVRFVPGSFSQSEMARFYEMADVVALPYLEGFGSGVLVSAMRFGVFIAATATGGAEEYLAAYPSARILRSPEPAEIAAALAEARRRSLAGELARTPGLRPSWEEFARTVITLLE
jgi:glycosyltransferase involved in cell wall biosynthesis